MSEKLYQAYIFSCPEGWPQFQLSEIPVVKVYENDRYRTESSYPCEDGDFTVFFGDGCCGALNEEIRHTEEITVYYSLDREQCQHWLEQKRAELIDRTMRFLQRLEQSVIKEVPPVQL